MLNEVSNINCINDMRTAVFNTGRHCFGHKCIICFFYCYVRDAGNDDIGMWSHCICR